MIIALFDSGVNGDCNEIQNQSIQHIDTNLYLNDKRDNIGHGTAIAYILQKCIEDSTKK